MNIYGGIDKHGYPTTDQINFTERQVLVSLDGQDKLLSTLEKRRRHCSSTSKRDRSKKGAVDADADDEDSSSDENQNHISDDEGVLDAKGIFQKFLDSLWDTLPSHAVYLRKPLPDPTPVFSRDVLNEYVTSFNFITPRNTTWESRFHWYFPGINDSREHMERQGWVSLKYKQQYFEWILYSTEEERQELKNLFMSMDVLPNSSIKERLWRTTKDKGTNRTSIQFVEQIREQTMIHDEASIPSTEQELYWTCSSCGKTMKRLKNGNDSKPILNHKNNCPPNEQSSDNMD